VGRRGWTQSGGRGARPHPGPPRYDTVSTSGLLRFELDWKAMI
jgi:hypothetical protein